MCLWDADKGTGKKQDIKITGASTLAGDEVDRMVKDAEKFADEDKKKREAVDVKNQVGHHIALTLFRMLTSIRASNLSLDPGHNERDAAFKRVGVWPFACGFMHCVICHCTIRQGCLLPHVNCHWQLFHSNSQQFLFLLWRYDWVGMSYEANRSSESCQFSTSCAEG
jgi:hypothetical protein